MKSGFYASMSIQLCVCVYIFVWLCAYLLRSIFGICDSLCISIHHDSIIPHINQANVRLLGSSLVVTTMAISLGLILWLSLRLNEH